MAQKSVINGTIAQDMTDANDNFTELYAADAAQDTLIAGKADNDHTHGEGGTVASIVADYASIGTGNTVGEKKTCQDTGFTYTWFGSAWVLDQNHGKVFATSTDAASGTSDFLDSKIIAGEGTSIAGTNELTITTDVNNATITAVNQRLVLEAFYRVLDGSKSVEQDFVTGWIKSNPDYYRMSAIPLTSISRDYVKTSVSAETQATEECLKMTGSSDEHTMKRRQNYGYGSLLFEFEELNTDVANDNDFLAYLSYYCEFSPTSYDAGIVVEFYRGSGSVYVGCLTNDGYATYSEANDTWNFSADASYDLTLSAWSTATDSFQLQAKTEVVPKIFVDEAHQKEMVRVDTLDPLLTKPYLLVYALEENDTEGLNLYLKEARFNAYLNEKFVGHGTAGVTAYPNDTLAFKKYSLTSAPASVTAYAVVREYDTDALDDLSMKLATKMATISSENEVSNQLVLTLPEGHGFENSEDVLLVEKTESTATHEITQKSSHTEQAITSDGATTTTVTIDYNSDYGKSDTDYEVVELGGNIHDISFSTIVTHGDYKIIKGSATLTDAETDTCLFFTQANNKATGIVAAAAFFE